ncbi:hypothetical protein KFE25_003173 [Diacronema lutheri]|uniref:Ribosome-binding factor A n=1 Tax=Diacronema lutheri TaxID=2081491 RepID=A0A8J5X6X9_DIALT|nr:hypothetical protein KFE25_003173 [Diacronema lutheri]
MLLLARARTVRAVVLGARPLASSADAKYRSAEQRARRQLRVASKLQRALADLIADGARVRTARTAADVIVTGVTISSDLKAATAYWLPDPRSSAPVSTLAALLARQAPALSRRLADRSELRSVPRLSFQHDDSLVGTQRVTHLIELLALERAQREGAALATGAGELADGAVGGHIAKDGGRTPR